MKEFPWHWSYYMCTYESTCTLDQNFEHTGYHDVIDKQKSCPQLSKAFPRWTPLPLASRLISRKLPLTLGSGCIFVNNILAVVYQNTVVTTRNFRFCLLYAANVILIAAFIACSLLTEVYSFLNIYVILHVFIIYFPDCFNLVYKTWYCNPRAV